MKAIETVKQNMSGTEKKLTEHEERIKNLGIEDNINSQKTSAYMQGWINALKWIVREI